MPSKQDNQQRAEDFLRQWQEQMTRQMTSPDAINAMLAAMKQFGSAPDDANARRPAHAPDARDAAIRDLAERVRAMERQLAKLHDRLLSLDAKAKKPARAKRGAAAKPVAAAKRAVAERKPVVKSKRTTTSKRRN